MDTAEPKKTLLIRIKELAPFGIFIAIFMMGFGLASFLMNQDLRRKDEQIAQKENEARQHTEDLKRIGAELQQAKLELVRAQEAKAPRAAEPSAPTAVERGSTAARKQPIPETKPRAVPDRATSLESEEISLQAGNTGAVFGGDIVISLVAVPFGGDPLHHRVLANVGSPGRPTASFNLVDIGYTTTYRSAKASYDIRVTGADTLRARFLVTRL